MTKYPPRKTETIQAVAFDMDGLILNTEDLYEKVVQELVTKRGKTYCEITRKQMIGLPAEQAFEVLIQGHELTDAWHHLRDETELLLEQVLEHELALMPGVSELFAMLDREGIPRCVATSSTRVLATRALMQVGVMHRIDFLLTAQDVPRGKPHPDIYLEASRRLGCEIERMLVLEDSETGTRAGVSSGAYVVSVVNRHTEHGNFEGAKQVLRTLEDGFLKELLTR